MEKGLTHLYYGDGKGKTTAATGLCIRAAGNRKRVLFTQFMKDGASGEISLLEKIPGIEVLYGNVPCGFYHKMDEETKKLFAKEQEKLLDAVIERIEKEIADIYADGNVNRNISSNTNISTNANRKANANTITNTNIMLLVLDEITYAYNWNLIDRAKLEKLLNNRPDFLEIVMTGRNPDKFLVDAADYVTEMKCEKHPFEQGIQARKGIEF